MICERNSGETIFVFQHLFLMVLISLIIRRIIRLG